MVHPPAIIGTGHLQVATPHLECALALQSLAQLSATYTLLRPCVCLETGLGFLTYFSSSPCLKTYCLSLRLQQLPHLNSFDHSSCSLGQSVPPLWNTQVSGRLIYELVVVCKRSWQLASVCYMLSLVGLLNAMEPPYASMYCSASLVTSALDFSICSFKNIAYSSEQVCISCSLIIKCTKLSNVLSTSAFSAHLPK